MSGEFLMIAPQGWNVVQDNSILPYGAAFFEQHEGVVGNTEITQMFRDIGLITEAQSVEQVKYINETDEVWYSLQV